MRADESVAVDAERMTGFAGSDWGVKEDLNTDRISNRVIGVLTGRLPGKPFRLD